MAEIREIARRKLESFRKELEDITDDYEQLLAMLEEIELEAYGLFERGEEALVEKLDWFSADSLLSLYGKGKAPKKRNKQGPMCDKCKNTPLSNTEDCYRCPICGLTKSKFSTKTSSSKTKSSPERSIGECAEWMACLCGEEDIPHIVKIKIPEIHELLKTKGKIPTINQMRTAFKSVGLGTHYKHCVAVRGELYHVYPKTISHEDREIILNMFKIILPGFTKLREEGQVKNIRYIPTIIKWCIYKQGWQEKYKTVLDCVCRKNAETENKIYTILAKIWN